MKRDRHSLLPQPISRSKSFEASYKQRPSYLGKAGEDQVFSKLLLCTPNEVVDLILNWEKIELQTQLEAEKDCPESCFIQQALELLLVREQNTAVQSLSSFAAQLVIFISVYVLNSINTKINNLKPLPRIWVTSVLSPHHYSMTYHNPSLYWRVPTSTMMVIRI